MTKRLGRGLADLIDVGPQPYSPEIAQTQERPLHGVPIAEIRSGRFQPRTSMDEKAISELKASIQRQGLIEPIIVRPRAEGGYELVAGERRLRAAAALGMTEIPAIVKALSDKEAFEYALTENIQRENLTPIEEARGYTRLLEEFAYTQEDVAQAVGKDRATVANLLRLLHLPEEIQRGLSEGAITLGHAKVLMGVEPRLKQVDLYHLLVKQGMTVRQLEGLVSHSTGAWRRSRRARLGMSAEMQRIEDEIRRVLGTKVSLTIRKKGGRVVIDYFSPEDLTRILQVLGVSSVVSSNG